MSKGKAGVINLSNEKKGKVSNVGKQKYSKVIDNDKYLVVPGTIFTKEEQLLLFGNYEGKPFELPLYSYLVTSVYEVLVEEYTHALTMDVDYHQSIDPIEEYNSIKSYNNIRSNLRLIEAEEELADEGYIIAPENDITYVNEFVANEVLNAMGRFDAILAIAESDGLKELKNENPDLYNDTFALIDSIQEKCTKYFNKELTKKDMFLLVKKPTEGVS